MGKNGERKEKDAGAVLQFSALDYPIIAPKGGVFVRVYLEVVILDNFFIDLLLLSALSALLPPRASLGRRCLAAGLGTLYAVLTPLRQFRFLAHPAIKMGVGLLLVFAAFGFGDWRTYGKRALAFFGLGALLGGLVIAGGFLFGSPTAAGRGYIVTGIPLWLLIPVSLLSVKGCETLVRRIKDAISREDAVLTVRIRIGDTEISLPGMVDSGNLLTMPGTGVPVIVCGREPELMALWPQIQSRMLELPVHSIGGEQSLQAFRPDGIQLCGKDTKEVTAAVAVSQELARDIRALVPVSLL